MLHFIRQMMESFRAITPQVVAEQGNFKLSVILIREMSEKLNMTHSLAAEIVGEMKIQVDNDAYHQDPELFNDTARAMVGVMEAMLAAYTKEFDASTAYAFLNNAAKGMSLTYG
jgi:hypothetical protein